MIPEKKAGDADLYFQQFMKYLDLQIENTNKILAESETGYIPSAIVDTRTTREKLADTLKLKRDVMNGLREIADGTEISQIVSQLTDGELIFLAQHLSEIIKTLKPRYRYGITSLEFLEYLRQYIDTYTAAHGVDFGGNTGLLDRIETLIDRLPQRNDIAEMNRILREQIVNATEHLERRIAQAAATNDNAQQEYFLRLMYEINEKHNAVSRDLREIQNAIGEFQTSIDNMEKSLGDVNKEQLNQIVERLKDLPDTETFITSLETIQNAIQNSDYQTLLEKLNDLTQNVQRIKDTLTLSQIKSGILTETEWKPLSWSSIKGMRMADILRYLQLTQNIIIEHSLNRPPEDLVFSEDLTLSSASNRVLQDIDRIRSLFGNKDLNVVAKEISTLGVNIALKKEEYQEFRDTIGLSAPKERFIKWMEDSGIQGHLITFNTMMKGTIIPVKGVEESKESGPPPSEEPPTDEPPVTGSGLVKKTVYFPQRGRGVISGRGITDKPRKRYDKINPEDVDHTRGVKPTPKFVPLGKYFINHHRLINDGFLSVKSMSGAGVHGLPPTKVSQNFVDVIESMLKNKNPSFDALNNLSQGEKEYLYKLAKKSNILDRFTIPTPDKSKEEKELHEFEVLRGQIMAGNDNKDLIKKFKLKLVKLTHDGHIPKSQSNAILAELATLGFD